MRMINIQAPLFLPCLQEITCMQTDELYDVLNFLLQVQSTYLCKRTAYIDL